MAHEDMKAYYERRYDKERLDAFPFDEPRTRAHVLPVLTGVAPGGRVLDIGCGVGYACEYLARAGYEVCGVDIAEAALELARTRLPEAEFRVPGANGELPWAASHFDGIVCLGVLEHIPQAGALLEECRRVLNREGVAVFVVPNSRSPYFLLTPGTGQAYERPRNHREWAALFGRHGFSVCSVGRDPGPSLSTSNSLAKTLKLLLHRGLNRLPISYTYQFIFELKPL